MQNTPIAVIGAGSWGTALALHLSRLGQVVHLWSHETDHIHEMARDRINQRYLPKHPFPPSLLPLSSLTDTLNGVKTILIAVPSAGFRETLALLKPLLNADTPIVWATKGLDEKTGQLLHEVADEILEDSVDYAVLSGPSFAGEVAAGLPTAVVIASRNQDFAKALSNRFTSSRFRVYLSTDVIGVEMGGAVKNVLAIATGISDGMGFGTNARCALITRGLAEMMRLASAIGGQVETVTGLTGLGDLVLTCTDNQSRNRRFGLLIGKGMDAVEAEREIGQVVEGRRNTELVYQLAKKKSVEMPIVDGVLSILQGKMTPAEVMKALFERKPVAE